MAYTAANLTLITEAPLTGAGQLWAHSSADTGATAQAANFISDGGSRGIKVGDIVWHTNTSTLITTSHRVISVSTTYPGAVDLSDATTVVSGTNT